MSRKGWTSEKIFNRLITNRTKSTYWDNISELRKRPNAEVYNRAYELCTSSIEKEKIIGIYVLAQLGFNPRMNKSKTVRLYIELLKGKQSPKVIEAILSSIGHNNDGLSKKYITELVRFREHRYSDIRFGLTLAVSGIENEEAIKTLIHLSNDNHPEVRNYATWSLGTQLDINSVIVLEALWNRIEDTDRATRFEAIYGLAKRKDHRIKEQLLVELKRIDNHGSQILESIEALNDVSFAIHLEKQTEKNKSTKMVNEKWLLDTLKNLKGSQE